MDILNFQDKSNSLGEVVILPDHYLTPMNAYQIKLFINARLNPHNICKEGQGWGSLNCFLKASADATLEEANLKYVNKLISWDQLQVEYTKASEMYASARYGNKNFIQQLKEVGTVAVGAVKGFFSEGPTGIFTGGAEAANKIIEEGRNKDLQKAQTIFSKLQDGTSVFTNLEKHQQYEMIKKYLPFAGIALAVIAGGVLVFSD